MSRLLITLTISCLALGVLGSDDPFAYGTTARLDLAAKADKENEVLAQSVGYSLDDKSQGASYARGDGASDANVQLSSDVYTDSNAVNVATDGGSDSDNGFAVSNVKSELAKDDNLALYNSNPKYWAGFPGLENQAEWNAYRTYTLSTNMTKGANTNGSTRGISSRRRNRRVGVTSNRSQNNADGGDSVSNALSLSNGTVNNAKVHSQNKASGSDSIQTINDVAAAQVKGIAAASQIGSANAKGINGSEASQISNGDNLGFGFTQSAGSATANEGEANANGHIKAFYNPNRRQAGKN